MKLIGVADARNNLSEHIEASQTERVVIMRHGKPAAVLVGVAGSDVEAVLRAADESFWDMVGHARESARSTRGKTTDELRTKYGIRKGRALKHSSKQAK